MSVAASLIVHVAISAVVIDGDEHARVMERGRTDHGELRHAVTVLLGSMPFS
jgi:hypothetical protein